MEMPNKVQPATAETSGTLVRAVVDASAGAHNTVDRMSDVVRPAVDRIAAGAHQAVDGITRAASQTADSLDARGEQLRNSHARMSEQCRGYVRENPLAAIGIAVAAGFVLSRVLKTR